MVALVLAAQLTVSIARSLGGQQLNIIVINQTASLHTEIAVAYSHNWLLSPRGRPSSSLLDCALSEPVYTV